MTFISSWFGRKKGMRTPPLATYESLWSRGFDAVFKPLQKGLLAGFDLRVPANLPPHDRPWIYIANHPSNWDGFLLRQIHQRLRGNDPIFSVMLERELKGLSIFRRIGALGLEPGNPHTTRRLLNFLKHHRRHQPSMALGFFPQGELTPPTRFPLGFRRGIETFVDALAPAYVIPIGFHLDFESGMRPTVHARMGRVLEAERRLSLESMEDAVTEVLHELLVERRALPTYPTEDALTPSLTAYPGALQYHFKALNQTCLHSATTENGMQEIKLNEVEV
jgi:1-acyl-sn-glycerol-3-phosphate acyltransferase